MSGPYRGGRGDDPLAYGERPGDFDYGGRGGGRNRSGSNVGGGAPNRWDTDRFATERGGRGSGRFDSIPDRDIYEERDSRTTTRGGGFGRPRERSVDEIYERRGPGYGDDRYERRHYHDDDAPRFERAPQPPPFGDPFDRHNSTTVIEKERDVYSPPPPRRGSNRPAFMRRQSSLDTFDRKPMTRFVETREEYGPPARYRPDTRAPPMVPIPLPLPKTRQLGPPPRRYAERDYEDTRVTESEVYEDDGYGGAAYPERVREREVIRRRRRSRSRDSITSRRSHRSRRAESVRSDSISSSSSSDRGTVRSVRGEFPKRGKTRMPARLVSKKAIIDLGYPFEEDGDTIIIMRALGRENIDEVIKLSESYNDIPSKHFSSGHSDAGTTVYEEHKTQEIITIPAPPPPAPIIIQQPAAPPPVVAAPIVQEVVTDTKVVEHYDHHHAGGPVIINATPQPSHHHHDSVEIRETQYVDRSDALVIRGSRSRSRNRDEHAIRSEIRALEAEKELLRRERRHRGHHHSGRSSNTELVMYDKEHFHANGEDVTIVRKEAIIEPDGGVRIEKDRKGRMAISVPKYIR